MKLRTYYIITTLMAVLASPAVASIGIFSCIIFISNLRNAFIYIIIFFLPLLLLAGMWILYSKKVTLPQKASQLFLPFAIAFYYYIFAWIIFFGVFHYNVGDDRFFLFITFTFPYIVANILLLFTGHMTFFPLVHIVVTLIAIFSVIITCKISKKEVHFDKKLIIIFCSAALFLTGIAAFQYYDRSTKIISEDNQVEQISNEVNLYYYHPFTENNLLKKFDAPEEISFTENYPILDGATATYPVYSAIVQELYKGLDSRTVEEYVTCSNTVNAYQRLINGEIDIFFGAQPSRQQMEAAREKGVELSLIPIAKEAFVFFVNKDNPVNCLTLGQIQDIYQKKITNWKDVGGKEEKIMPFQRPENSGSQTIMLARVMGDKPLPAPLREEYVTGMGGIINQVADYRNYSSSIGYSFRFFATGMKPNENIKLIDINGIAPSTGNIRNSVYPFTVDVYAVTAGSTNENTKKLLQWILSDQGQSFIEICGYIRIN